MISCGAFAVHRDKSLSVRDLLCVLCAQVIKTAPGVSLVSSIFFMLLPDRYDVVTTAMLVRAEKLLQ